MDRLRSLVLLTVFSAFLPTIAWAQSPRVMVELAFVSRIQQRTDQTPLKNQFETMLPQSKLAEEGLVPFLDDWLRGKDRDLHEVDLMKLKIPLGEEVEFATRHSLATKFTDPKSMFDAADIPKMPGDGLLSDGLDATVRAEKLPDGKIRVRFRFGKLMPPTMEKDESSDKPDAPQVPGQHRQWINSGNDLTPQQTAVLGGLLQSVRKDGKNVTRELTILVRVHLADPTPFPID
ncbi:hypothetical protein [Bremerella alba]|uniref:Uncharacterized protein n=1 Tax=Bremerella alba TaxID=980252 RepID=A0A7V9A9K8_9BACT|nr:hypothetical protein [Bremerella alba]MBA2117261.1 hypothetical protein [Bremerella alba]